MSSPQFVEPPTQPETEPPVEPRKNIRNFGLGRQPMTERDRQQKIHALEKAHRKCVMEHCIRTGQLKITGKPIDEDGNVGSRITVTTCRKHGRLYTESPETFTPSYVHQMAPRENPDGRRAGGRAHWRHHMREREIALLKQAGRMAVEGDEEGARFVLGDILDSYMVSHPDDKEELSGITQTVKRYVDAGQAMAGQALIEHIHQTLVNLAADV